MILILITRPRSLRTDILSWEDSRASISDLYQKAAVPLSGSQTSLNIFFGSDIACSLSLLSMILLRSKRMESSSSVPKKESMPKSLPLE